MYEKEHNYKLKFASNTTALGHGYKAKHTSSQPLQVSKANKYSLTCLTILEGAYIYNYYNTEIRRVLRCANAIIIVGVASVSFCFTVPL